MAFRTRISPTWAYERAKQVAKQARAYAASRSAEFQSTTNRDVPLVTAFDIKRYRDELQSLSQTQGIVQYAKDQEDDQTYDVVAEFTAMQSAMTAVVDEVVNTFPTSASGAIEEKQLNPDATLTFFTFTPGQLSTLRGLLDAVVAAIDP